MRDYKKLFKAIRPYVNFNHDLRTDLNNLSASDKRRITRNYNIIRPLLSRNNKVYRPRGKNKAKNLKAAQRFGQHRQFSKDINVALIPTDGEAGTRVIVRDGKVTVQGKFVRSETLLFDAAQLATRPKEHAEELAKQSGADKFHIHAGEYLIKESLSKRQVGRRVAQLVERYQEGGDRYKSTITPSGRVIWDNHYGQWMTGLTASFFENQDDFDEYQLNRFDKKKRTNVVTKKKKRKKKKTKKKKTRKKK